MKSHRYAAVAVGAAPVRRKAGHRNEMVNQLLFGETVKILREKEGEWVKVRSLHDNYEGWMTSNLLEPLEEEQADVTQPMVTLDTLSTVTVAKQVIHVPVGSTLPFFKQKKGRLGAREYSLSGDHVDRKDQQPAPELLDALTRPWLNAPYLWGGRTPLGVDCSGFVQVIYKIMGIDLPRDAWQQAQEGVPVKYNDIQPGDLAFFDNREEIVHVGILLGDNRMIHSSGTVHITEVGKKGIVGSHPKKRERRLRAIRRVWPVTKTDPEPI